MSQHVQMRKFFWFLFFFLAMGSCLDEPDCVNMNNGFIGISFKKMFDEKADTVNFISIQSPESDSIFYSFTSATAIQLPLNQFATQTSYTLEEVYNENFLVMNYANSVAQFVSEDCGTRYVFSDLEFSGHDFDSLKVITTDLFTTVQTNLEVYRCPRTNLVKVAFRQLIGTTERADTVYLSNLSADYPAQFFIPTDTLSSVNLPLNQNASSTTFYFSFKDGSSRTITFNYTRTPWDEFETWCGSQTLFSDLSSSVFDFSEIEIRKDSVQDPPLTNVAIFK
jgi:hypothetical protein